VKRSLVLAAIATGVAALVAFVIVERRVAAPDAADGAVPVANVYARQRAHTVAVWRARNDAVARSVKPDSGAALHRYCRRRGISCRFLF
jgi:hypothetical protein